MVAPSLRDRLLTHAGARAALSPVGLAAGLAVAVVAAVVGLPLWAAAVLGVAVWAGNAWRLLPRGPRPDRIDPFTLHDPWRRFVQQALQSRARFDQAVERAPAGPLRDRLQEIGQRVEAGVEQCWLIARRGQTLVVARRGIDVAELDRQLADLGGAPGGGNAGAEAGGTGYGPADAAPADAAVARLTESLQSQRAAADRLDRVIDRAQTELRLLDARLGEAVVRTLELSAHASADAGGQVVEGLLSNVDGVVSEMESLRQALDEADTAAGGVAGSLRAGEPPPDGPV